MRIPAAVLPGPVLAHGIGGRQDLPVPLEVFVVAASVVLVLSFVALAVLWPRPRMQTPPIEREVSGWWVRWMAGALRVLGVAGLVLVVAAGLVGVDNPTRNPASVLVFVVFWLVIPFQAAIAGDVYPVVDPWRTSGRLLGLPDDRDPGLVDRVGYRPAAVAFVAFTWLELVAPDGGPRALALAAIVYSAYLFGVGAWRGTGTAATSFDGFAAYNRLLGAMAPLRWDAGGRLYRRPWLRGLPAVRERPGLVALVVAMIGTVSYDGAGSTPWWDDWIATPLAAPFSGLGRTAAELAAGTIGLLGVTALVGLAYLAASGVAARLGRSGTARSVATRFAHTLVPIAFAYAFAHYFTLVVFEGQLLLSTMSDPFGLGWDLFGTAGRPIDYGLIAGSADWVWYVQVAAIVGGHVAGVVLAHDRALSDFPPSRAVASQYAMLALMVALTGLGLVILSAG